MNWAKVAAPLLAMLLTAAPAAAQMSLTPGDFVDAVRDRDGDKAMEMLQSRGSQIINLRDD